MEVHHHAHTSRKRWTHYFWEFLMLFLAVFCGFLAEYQLEHKIEKDRERQYMQSMLEDLHRDTAVIQAVYDLGMRQMVEMDSLLMYINDLPLTPQNISNIYFKNSSSGRIIRVGFETRTSSQLKNAGGMRLIRKKSITDSILRYWDVTQTCESIGERMERIGELRFNVSAKLFHNKYYVATNTPLTPVIGIKPGAKFISDDPTLLAEYSNRTYSRRAVLNNYMTNMKRSKGMAISLMDEIRRAYHLE